MSACYHIAAYCRCGGQVSGVTSDPDDLDDLREALAAWWERHQGPDHGRVSRQRCAQARARDQARWRRRVLEVAG